MKNLLYLFVAFLLAPGAIAQENRGGGGSNPFGLCLPTSTEGTMWGNYISSVYSGPDLLFEGDMDEPFYNYGDTLVNMTIGTEHMFTVTNGIYCCDAVELWIDWNGDDIFDIAELVFSGLAEDAGQGFNIYTTPSAELLPQIVGARVLVYTDSEPDVCGDFEYGQVFDFPISLNSYPNNFCTATYTTGGIYGDYISYFDAAGAYYSGGEFAAAYQYLPTEFGNVTVGAPLEVYLGGGEYVGDYYYLWIDENDSWTFEASELKASYYSEVEFEEIVFTYTPEASLPSGIHRARIACSYMEDEDPCSSGLSHGNVVDFMLAYTNTYAGLYCAPVQAQYGTTDGDYITSFNIDESGIGTYNDWFGPYYNDYTTWGYYYALAGASTTGQVTSGQYSNDNYKAWIDYNMDNMFDVGELVFNVASETEYSIMPLSWTNPEFTTEGLTRMRLMCHYDDELNDPCNIGLYGEVEDYSAILVKSNDMYCDPYFGRGNTDGDYISGFQLNEVNLTEIGAEITSFYNDFTSSVAETTQGESYTITITGGDYTTDRYKVWVDWNIDGVFDNTTEVVGLFQTSESFESFTMTLDVPMTATAGSTRLRLMCVDSETVDPCILATYGEYLEITLNVVEAIGVTEFAASNIALYPNPSSNELTLSLNPGWNQVQAIVYDASGRVIDTFNARGLYRWEHSYAPGLYTMELRTEDVQVVKTFIVK